jgi:hypothetical protein
MPIITFKPERRASEYDELIKTELAALVKATEAWEKDENRNADEQPATEFQVPTVDADKVHQYFAKAANEIDRTARARIKQSDGKVGKDVYPEGHRREGEQIPTGNTRFVFTLRGKDAPRRKTVASASSNDAV